MKAGWQQQKLGQVCRLISGQHIDSKDYNTEFRGVGYLTGPSDFGPLNPVVTKWTEHPKIKAASGDILITVKGSGVGKINLLDQDEVAISRQLMAVRVTEAEPRFVHAFLSSTFDHFQSLSTGAAIPGISREQVLSLEIPIPPLPEQQRIVGILGEAFDAIATAKANAEKNLQNARALFESHLHSVLTQHGEEWVVKRLGDVCHKITDGTHATPTYTKSGVPFLSVKDLTKGFIDFSDTRFISVEEHQALTRRCKPVKNDILYTKVGTTGVAQVVDVDEEFSIFVSVALLKINHEIIYNSYLEHFLNAPYAREQAHQRTRGMANKNLVITDIKEIVVHFPRSLEQQRSLVAEIDTLRAETRRLESIYRQKLAALDALKKSLLDQAFTGLL